MDGLIITVSILGLIIGLPILYLSVRREGQDRDSQKRRAKYVRQR